MRITTSVTAHILEYQHQGKKTSAAEVNGAFPHSFKEITAKRLTLQSEGKITHFRFRRAQKRHFYCLQTFISSAIPPQKKKRRNFEVEMGLN